MANKDAVKVVVRLLPPAITEDELFGTMNETHLKKALWKCFVPGKRYKSDVKPSRNATCYLQFANSEQAEDFMRDFHGHAFLDDKGESFRAVCCHAPYQKTPRPNQPKDPREGTIEEDPAYKAFLEVLSGPKPGYEAPEDPKTLLRPENPSDTPLIKHMQVRAKDRRAQAEKRSKRWKESLGWIAEEASGRGKWRCSECGTSKRLEEDPDNRGTFYCSSCWEGWEAHGSSKKKKKSKKQKEEEWPEEEWPKKKKKKKSKTQEEEWAEWYDDGSKSKAKYDAEEESSSRRRRKKKKDGEEGEDDYGGRSWRAKGEDEWEEKPSRKSRHKEAEWWETDERPSRKSWDDEDRGSKKRWQEAETSSQSKWPEEEKPSKKKSGKGGEEGKGSRWRAKDEPKAAEEEEWGGEKSSKPRKGRKDRRGDEEAEEKSQWRPKRT